MTASRTSLLAALFRLGAVGSIAAGLAPSAAADPEVPEPPAPAPYCEALASAMPAIAQTYRDLKKTADLEVLAEDAPAEDNEEEDEEAQTPAQPVVELDAEALLQKEVDLAEQLTRQLNDLAHLTQEAGLKRIALEATDTAGSFAAALHARQDGDAPDGAGRSMPGGEAPDPADTTNVGMLSGMLHPAQPGSADDSWYADFNFNSNKLRNEMNALSHLCQGINLSQPDGAVAPGSRHAG